jgi:acetyl-CoA carboxylase biotin carboxyl carrier protein
MFRFRIIPQGMGDRPLRPKCCHVLDLRWLRLHATASGPDSGRNKIETTMAQSSETFDLEKLQQLIELMEKHDLREVRLRRGDQQWLLRRGARELVPAVPMHPMPSYPSIPFPGGPAPAPAPTAPAQPAAAAPAAQPAAESGTPVKSPMVGTFYASPQPGEPAFVKVGDKVKSDSTVCLLEAMKFFNPIKAEVSGTVTKILAKDGDAVEFGQTLFIVKPD